MTDIAIVGSINQDLTVVTDRHPMPGETVLGSKHFSGGGGKGANQAVAAARLGASVAMVGRVGADTHGNELRAALLSEGVEVSMVEIDPNSSTGLALITVDGAGENTIVVSPGANWELGADQVRRSTDLLSRAKVVLCQLEIPIESVQAAAQLAGGVFCLNPAPGRELPEELLERVDVLIPNRNELAMITGVATPDARSALISARQIEGPGSVVVTLGSEGALVVEGDDWHHVAAPEVTSVDTTGAGDAFCGALAVALGRDHAMVDAARWAVVAGALATMTPGARASMPTESAIARFVDIHGLPEVSRA
jgi:ribokinase